MMSSKRKTHAPTRVLVDASAGQSAGQSGQCGPCERDVIVAPAAGHRDDLRDDDDEQSHVSQRSHDERLLRVVTSPSSATDDDDDDDAGGGGPVDDVTAAAAADVTVTSWRWALVRRLRRVLDGAQSAAEKRRLLDDMLAELETIREQLVNAQADCDVDASPPLPPPHSVRLALAYVTG